MTFLFDIGNVLLNLHFDRLESALGISPSGQELIELDNLKEIYERGGLDDDQFVSRASALLPTKPSQKDFVQAWGNIFSANVPMWEIAQQLKSEGHRLILFSNTNALHARAFLKDYPDFDLFEHHHFSHEVGSLKPDPAFYERAINAYDLIPAETAYLDDLPANIETGTALGFQSHQYAASEHQAAQEWITNLLS